MRTKKKTMLAGCAAVGLILPAMAERIKYDFETGDLQGWKIVQGHFAKPVSDRAKEHHGDRPYVKEGKWFLSTLERPDGRPDDSQTGVIESPSFRLLSPRVTFRVGGDEFLIIEQGWSKEAFETAMTLWKKEFREFDYDGKRLHLAYTVL